MNPENQEEYELSRQLRNRTYTYNPAAKPKKATRKKKVKLQANTSQAHEVSEVVTSQVSNPIESANLNENLNENNLNNSKESLEYRTADSSQEEIDISVLFHSPVKMSGQPKLTFDASVLTAAGVDASKVDQLNKFLQEQVLAATSNIKVTATTQSSIPAPQFDSDTMSAESYFTQLENYFNIQGIKADNFHTAVGPILRGDKKTWYDNIATAITTWKDFKDKFVERFDSIHIQERRRHILYHRWQKDWEPVDNFVNEIVNLSKQCYPKEDAYMHVLRAKNRLYPFLREKITVEDEKTLTINLLIEKAAYAIETQKAKDKITNRHTRLPPITGHKTKLLHIVVVVEVEAHHRMANSNILGKFKHKGNHNSTVNHKLFKVSNKANKVKHHKKVSLGIELIHFLLMVIDMVEFMTSQVRNVTHAGN